MVIETRDVLADAHVNNRGRSLRHAVEVDAEGLEVRVLCSRVALEALADRFAGDPTSAPTCRQCLAAVRRQN